MAFNKIKTLFKEQFNIEIKNREHYDIAFTHSSYVNEKRRLLLEDNERIEFLGDAVLELGVSQYLYRHYPELAEGDMSRYRALIVREESLSRLCLEYGFDQYILLGHGEEANGGRKRPALLCDLFESVIGALYLDLGIDEIEHFFQLTIYPKIKKGEFKQQIDAKTALQEELQKKGQIRLSYAIVGESGPAHDKQFIVEVQLDGMPIGQGTGQSKKTAEQAAALAALNKVEEHASQ